MSAIGKSMVPTIWPGDSLVVEPATGNDVSAGDIVLFSNSCRFVAHRLVEKENSTNPGELLTRGDAMPTADAPIRQSELLGRVSLVVRDGKCFEVKKTLRWSERALSALLRRSDTAARVVLGVHKIRQASSKAV